MANHLIIGLGGTGGNIVRELRKRIVEENGSLDPQNGTYVEYMYVDSSPTDLDDRSQWKVLGKSVHLGDAQKVSINGLNQNILNNPAGYPGFHSFITPEDRQLMQVHLGTLINTGIGGQRRRLGRLLFANNVCGGGNGVNFTEALESAVNRLTRDSGVAGCTFHICAGLAGGTGSGTIIDAIAQIRKRYQYNLHVPDVDDRRYKIRLFVYVPEQNIEHASHNVGFYQANGYAALQELNAISVNKYAPKDVSGELDHNTNEVRRLLENEEAFQIAYLFTNVNEQGRAKDIATTLPQTVADFIYQTVIVANTPGINGGMSRLVASENAGAQPENDSSGIPSRSRRFMSFGISKVIYPETEIKEYVSYSLARESFKQLLYNHWTPGQGYNDHITDSNATRVRQEIDGQAFKSRFRTADEYLTAEKGIVSDNETQRWRNFESTWEDSIDRISQRVKDDKGILHVGEWLKEFKDRVDAYNRTQFRGVGVERFFDIQRNDIGKSSEIIKRQIEDALFDEWINPTKDSRSLLQIKQFLDVLENELTDRKASFKNRRNTLNGQLLNYEAELSKTETAWNTTNPIKQRVSLYPKYVDDTFDYNLTRVKIMSLDHAVALVNRLSEGIISLSNQTNTLIQNLNSCLDDANAQAESRCVIGSADDVSSSIIKLYDPSDVRRIVEGYKSNDDIQHNNVSATHQKLIELLGTSERSFQNIVNKLNFDQLLDEVFSVQAVNVLQDTANRNSLEKMINVNVLDIIRTKFNTQNSMEAFIKDVETRASAHLPFNAAEKALVGAGTIQQLVEIALPQTNEPDLIDFRNTFQGYLSQQIPNVGFSDNNKSNQVVVVNAYAGFPLRYSSNLSVLRSEYEKLVAPANPNWKLNKMQLHTESFTEPLPALYELSPSEIREMSVKPLMKAFAMGLVQLQTNTVTGRNYYGLQVIDNVGVNWKPLGQNFVECLDNLSNNLGIARTLIRLVDEKQRNDYQHIDRRRELQNSLRALDADILNGTYQGDITNPSYQQYRTKIQAVITELN